MRMLILLLFAACLIGKAVGTCSLVEEKSGMVTALILRNDHVEARILPAHSGVVTSFRLRQTGIELLEPFEETVQQFSPLLPPQISANSGGYADWLWGQRVTPRGEFSYEILDHSAATLRVRLTGRIGSWQISRVIGLADDSFVLTQQVTLTNESKQSAEIDYWAHLLPAGSVFAGAEDKWLVVPAARGGERRKSRTMEPIKMKGIRVFSDMRGDSAFVPAQAWIARVSANPPATLLLRSRAEDFVPDGFLYQWQDRDKTTGREIATLEMVMGHRVAAPGESLRFTADLAGFPAGGIPAAIFSNMVLYVRDGQIQVYALAPVKGTLELSGKEVPLHLAAGKNFQTGLDPVAGEVTLRANDSRETTHFEPSTLP